MMEALMDPELTARGFCRTTENLFDASFLVKDGSLGVELNSKHTPLLRELPLPVVCVCVRVCSCFHVRYGSASLQRSESDRNLQTRTSHSRDCIILSALSSSTTESTGSHM